MKKIILSLLAAITFITVNAQEKQAPKGKVNASSEQHIEKRLNKLNEVTGGLSDEQKVRVKAILEEHTKQAEADRQKFAGDKEKMKEAQKKRRANSDARLKEVLSPEQYEKVMAHRKEMREKRKATGADKSNHQQHDKDEIYD
ncbi:MAG: hypothetical protein ACK4ON_00740 [Bacteroidia bacterium]